MNTTNLIYTLLGVFLIVTGLSALIIHRHFIRKLIALNIFGVGVFCILISGAFHPIYPADPLPHAMVLTGIVVAVSATGLCLNMVKRLNVQNEEDS